MPGEHGPGQCSCRHESESLGAGTKWLNPTVALDAATALNIEEDSNLKNVLKKAYDDRLNDDEGHIITPEDDNELLIHIPFESPVQLAGIYIIGGEEWKHPKKVKLYANPAGTFAEDFSSINDLECTQEIELALDYCGAIEYPVKAHKFNNLQHLIMYFETDEMALEEEIPKEIF